MKLGVLLVATSLLVGCASDSLPPPNIYLTDTSPPPNVVPGPIVPRDMLVDEAQVRGFFINAGKITVVIHDGNRLVCASLANVEVPTGSERHALYQLNRMLPASIHLRAVNPPVDENGRLQVDVYFQDGGAHLRLSEELKRIIK